VEFKHSFHFETNQSVSIQEIATGIVAEIRDRSNKFMGVFDCMSFAFSFFFLVVFFK
jgi:hypothetical protein